MANPIQVILFDLDDTLYPSASGVWQAIGERINQFMIERANVPAEQVARVREEYFRAFGTTLNGLRLHHGVDPAEYLAFVHDIPLNLYLKPDDRLRSMLDALPQRKVVFSNADAAHARRVLRHLGVESQFDQIIDIQALQLVNKPDPSAYRKAAELLGSPPPSACLIVDDLIQNLLPAKELGWVTVWLNGGQTDPAADFSIRRIYELALCLQALDKL